MTSDKQDNDTPPVHQRALQWVGWGARTLATTTLVGAMVYNCTQTDPERYQLPRQKDAQGVQAGFRDSARMTTHPPQPSVKATDRTYTMPRPCYEL